MIIVTIITIYYNDYNYNSYEITITVPNKNISHICISVPHPPHSLCVFFPRTLKKSRLQYSDLISFASKSEQGTQYLQNYFLS